MIEAAKLVPVQDGMVQLDHKETHKCRHRGELCGHCGGQLKNAGKAADGLSVKKCNFCGRKLTIGNYEERGKK